MLGLDSPAVSQLRPDPLWKEETETERAEHQSWEDPERGGSRAGRTQSREDQELGEPPE